MRVLIIDDEMAVHEAYRQCLETSARSAADTSLEAMAASLFADSSADTVSKEPLPSFECTFASQGLEGVALVEKSLTERHPFHVAFIDVRMPPGIDGKETAKRIRALDPEINIVIVSAYSDHGVTDIARVAGPPDKIFYISKPFTADEVCQMATALCWTQQAIGGPVTRAARANRSRRS